MGDLEANEPLISLRKQSRKQRRSYPLGATSSTFIATTSQPRSLLSMARLNIANSRARLSI